MFQRLTEFRGEKYFGRHSISEVVKKVGNLLDEGEVSVSPSVSFRSVSLISCTVNPMRALLVTESSCSLAS